MATVEYVFWATDDSECVSFMPDAKVGISLIINGDPVAEIPADVEIISLEGFLTAFSEAFGQVEADKFMSCYERFAQ